MDILIKGFNMPNKCKECPCREYGEFSFESDWCCLNEEDIKDVEVVSSKCPLIVLPSHGDLIDRDKIKFIEYINGDITVSKETVMNQPVVIQANTD